MSIHHSIVLIIATPDNEPFKACNEWCYQHSGQSFKSLDTSVAGGGKAFTAEVFAMEGNSFPWHELVAAMPSFGWTATVSLVIHVEGGRVAYWHAEGEGIGDPASFIGSNDGVRPFD